MISAQYKINGYTHSEKWDVTSEVAKARAKALFERGECDYVYITKGRYRITYLKRTKATS